MSGLYGPALPPGFRQRANRDDDDDDVVSSSGVNASSDVFRETCHVSFHSREADHHVTSEVRPSPTVVRHRADTHSEVSSTGQPRCCITTTRSDHQEMTVSSPSEEENTAYGPAIPTWRINGRGCPESVGEVSSSTSPVKGCELIGPCLPPGFGQSQPNDDSSASSSTCVTETSSDPKGLFASRISKSSVQSEDTSSTVGSSEPTSNSVCDIIGPALPPGFNSRHEEFEDDEENECDTNRSLPIGPCLPPSAATSSGIFGPALPPGFKSSSSAEKCHAMNLELPPSLVTEVEEDVIGPLPSEMFKKGMVDNSLAEEIEKRAANMKDKLEGKLDEVEVVSRETWMTELPPELGPGLGLTARQFKGNKSTSTGDRSVWTDTPADKAKKLKDQAEGRASKRSHESKEETISAKDQFCAERIAEFNKNKRSESLLDMHVKQRKIAKEQEAAAGPKERRPFDRDVDLGIVNLNSAQRKSIIDKSHVLNTRFGHGNSHFL